MAQILFTVSPAARLGSITSPGYTIPADVPESRIWLHADIGTTDAEDPTKSLTVGVESSRDGGATWRYEAGFTWVGHTSTPPPNGKPVQPPGVVFQVAALRGARVRATVAIPSRMTVGATVELLD